MRITGLATGLDMDQIVKDTMKPYRMKVDTTTQSKEIIEIKQQLYRDILKDSQEFYNKYFDVSKQDSLMLSKNWSSTSFTSSDESIVTVTGGAGALASNYKVEVKELAEKANVTYKLEDLKNTRSFELSFGGKTIEVENITEEELNNPSKLAERVNKKLIDEKIDIEVKYSQFSGGLVFESKVMGANLQDGSSNTINITAIDKDKNPIKFTNASGDLTALTGKGKDLLAVVTNARGESQTVKGSRNSVTFDGVTFNFHDTTKPGEEIKITGKTDSTAIKEKLVNFINDYNKIMTSLNEQTMKKPNKSYKPLTEEQKKEMSEDEIKLWNGKVKEGQLYRDSDLTRISNGLKSIMSSISPALEKFGISPVKDYSGTKNGTFTIDEGKLEEALEKNSEELVQAFIGKKDPAIANGQDGIMHRMKDFLYKETVTVTSALIKKVGLENSSTSANNALSRSIEKYNKKIADLEKDFARREQALYSKYARLEVMMNNYNSQQSYLMQQLGQ